ncbi:MAG: sialate O-acetylesterase [Chitinophagaceae bacterium]
MKTEVKILLLMLCVLLCLTAPAQLSLPKIIGNDMVLQRNQPVPVWGYAKPGEKIIVEFAKQQKTAVADDAGEWKVSLDAMSASSVPQKMIIKSLSQSITLNNILVGEVWICSGQSNMEYSMRKNSKVTVPAGADWPVNELENAHNKNIRIFLVERKKMKPDSTHAGWSVAEDSALRAFSAVGYFFAKKLSTELNVPIGIISSAIPGSRIEPWMPREAFTALPFFNDQSDTTHKIDGEPGKFYETMIAPLAPFAIKGFLWYQGESNCFLNERLQYAYKMEALINWWRKIWNNNQLPFYYVQIAPFAYSKAGGKMSYTQESLPEFWEAQQLALKIPQTAMIATTDLNFDLDNLHPHFKWEIGKRLAFAALANVYDKKSFIAMGPVYKSMKVDGNKIDIDFNFTGKGLVSNDNKELTGFTIAGADGMYVPAKAVIKNNTVEVWADNVKQPVSVRFSWNEGMHANLYNKNGLPALPFRTDNKLAAVFK